MLDLRDVLFPQFATHNALTVATIVEMAEDRSGFEFQRLHGMGEVVYESLSKSNDRVPCRIYAPVGGYRDLLAYLVRRLLENGANSSFVAVAGDRNISIESLLERPDSKLGISRGQSARNSQIPLPLAIYPDRPNSRGVEFGDRFQLTSLIEGMARSSGTVDAGPLAPGLKAGAAQEILLAIRSVNGCRHGAFHGSQGCRHGGEHRIERLQELVANRPGCPRGGTRPGGRSA